jgi:integrase
MPKLTQAYVDNVKWKGPSARDTHADALLPGFYLIVTKDGHKSFSCLYRIAGRQRKLTIGNAAQIDLGTARGVARDAFAAAAKGIDTQGLKVAARKASPETALSRLFETRAREFLKRHVAGQRTEKETEQAVEKLIEAWKGRQASAIGKADVLEHLDAIQDKGHARARDRRLGLIRKMFDWFIERGVTNANPAAGIKKLQPGGVKRQRVLTDDELRAVWNAAGELPLAHRAFVRLAMLTGQRREEVATIERTEIDKTAKLWTIPPEKFKNELVHLVPLSDAAMEIIEDLPTFTDENGTPRPFLITNTAGKRPIGGFADIKAELDKKSGVKDWVFHDLRRTVRTRLSAIGINSDVAERVIGHLPQGIRAVYDRHDFLAEKRQALKAWAAALDLIINPPAGNVRALHG